jgi:Uma2 family endonuclease
LQLIIGKLLAWANKKQSGTVIIDKGFLLGNNAILSAPLVWVSREKPVGAVIKTDGISQFCPDFVLEFRHRDDEIKVSKAKMRNWIANGCRMAWLIDEKRETVYIFEKSKVKMVVGFDKTISGEPVLPGFMLDISDQQG